MFGFLREHPYVFALTIAIITAVLVGLYERTIESDPEKVRTTFNKTLAAGVLTALALTWLVHRQEAVSCEPFQAD